MNTAMNIMLTENFDDVPARILTGKGPSDSEEGGERAVVPSRPDSGQDISIAGEDVNTGIVSTIWSVYTIYRTIDTKKWRSTELQHSVGMFLPFWTNNKMWNNLKYINEITRNKSRISMLFETWQN